MDPFVISLVLSLHGTGRIDRGTDGYADGGEAPDQREPRLVAILKPEWERVKRGN
jgi:hypothetical protein